MRVSGGSLPDGVRVEEHPQRDGVLVVRLTENVEQTEDGYTYDEYVMELPGYPGIKADIEANMDNWLEQAKAQEEQDKPADVRLAEARAEIERLATENAALKAANAALEDTICDLDEFADERIGILESVICEMDMNENGGVL